MSALRAAGRWTAESLPWLHQRPRSGMRVGGAIIWTAFIVFPLVDAIEHKEPFLRHALVIFGAAAFVGVYVWLVVRAFRPGQASAKLAVVAVMLALSCALSLADRPSWSYLFTYCAASAVLVGPASRTFSAVLVCTALSVTCSLVGDSPSTAVGAGASTLGVGLLIVLMRDLRTRNEELEAARAELADVAVAQERERFARDLHDLLGHSLSVIALKAELAGKLVAERPADAQREVREVEAVARTALSEVREAVSGYRRPTLEGEVAGARMALTAAGIEAEVQLAEGPVAPAAEAVLAWAVREGATNVIRHSGARHCTVRVTTGPADAAVEVLDDGRGAVSGDGAAAPVGGQGGNGLAGLGERAAEVGGRVTYGARPAGGGFALRVDVPVPGAPPPGADGGRP